MCVLLNGVNLCEDVCNGRPVHVHISHRRWTCHMYSLQLHGLVFCWTACKSDITQTFSLKLSWLPTVTPVYIPQMLQKLHCWCPTPIRGRALQPHRPRPPSGSKGHPQNDAYYLGTKVFKCYKNLCDFRMNLTRFCTASASEGCK